MTFAKVFLILAITLAVIGGGLWQFFLKDQVAFADVATAYVAKQACSCRYIGERSLDSCLTDFTQDVSQLDVTETQTDTRRTITASALGLVTASASYHDGLGCVIDSR
ncbi:MAG: hypothetical protein AAGK23_00525 [Pseudomonadota bacterium]